MEFGHDYGSFRGMRIDSWGAGPFEIEVRDRVYRFEDSDMFGPHRVNADGDPSSVDFGARSPFWEAHRLWVSQGRRLEDDKRRCIWDEPIPTIVQKIGSMHFTLQRGTPNSRGGTRYVVVEAPRRKAKP